MFGFGKEKPAQPSAEEVLREKLAKQQEVHDQVSEATNEAVAEGREFSPIDTTASFADVDGAGDENPQYEGGIDYKEPDMTGIQMPVIEPDAEPSPREEDLYGNEPLAAEDRHKDAA